MTTDPNATGTTPSTEADGSANATGTPSGAGAGGSAGGESIEDIRKRLQDEERKNAQLLSEKTAAEAARRENEELKARLAQVPPPAEQANPIADTVNFHRRVMASYEPGTFEHETSKATLTALQIQAEAYQQQQWRDWIDSETAKAPAEHREAVRSLLTNRKAADAETALNAVLGKSTSEMERLRKENEELRAKIQAGVSPDTDVRGVSARDNNARRQVRRSDAERIFENDRSPEARKLLADINGNRVEIVN